MTDQRVPITEGMAVCTQCDWTIEGGTYLQRMIAFMDHVTEHEDRRENSVGLLSVLGVILIVVGILALFGIVAIAQPWSIVLIVVGLVLTVWFGRTYIR